jgi:arginine decarboxylase
LTTTSIEAKDESSWTIQDALDLYLIDRWGSGYFGVNPAGEICVTPNPEIDRSVSLYKVFQAALEEGLKPPLLIRFQDIVRHRVRVLNEAFRTAIEQYGYENRYRTVYPIKVNQLREVVEEILDAGAPYELGLEAGSKPEIYAALAILDSPNTLIVCNGYKDPAYIRAALTGRKLGKEVILVAEKLSEVAMIVRLSAAMDVIPLVGLRMRLSTEGSGNWARSGGDDAKFGLSTAEVLQAIQILTDGGMAESLKLLHFHIGSQIPDILTIKNAVREIGRYYAKLRKMGHQIQYVDVGGGLAVDYDGSRSTFHSSMNYSIDEYARDVVYNIQDVCQGENVPQPCILSESGRALVAHHSVLVMSAFGSIRKTPDRVSLDVSRSENKLVKDILYTDQHLSEENLLESWHDLVQLRQEGQKHFEVGVLDLQSKALIEVLFWRIAHRIREILRRGNDEEVPEELMDLDKQLADQHICNFSVFQSLLDHWALGQVFPIVPVHRLNERPTVASTLVDITCDSDGKVSRFIDLADVATTLPLHSFGPDEAYYLGIFLTGAYQDIMGDNHNLLGRVSEVHVFLDDEEEDGYYIEERIQGSSVSEILATMQYDEKDLVKRLKAQVDSAIRSNRIKATEGMRLLDGYKRGLAEQTYLVLD